MNAGRTGLNKRNGVTEKSWNQGTAFSFVFLRCSVAPFLLFNLSEMARPYFQYLSAKSA